jgi:hypothetical protein
MDAAISMNVQKSCVIRQQSAKTFLEVINAFVLKTRLEILTEKPVVVNQVNATRTKIVLTIYHA